MFKTKYQLKPEVSDKMLRTYLLEYSKLQCNLMR